MKHGMPATYAVCHEMDELQLLCADRPSPRVRQLHYIHYVQPTLLECFLTLLQCSQVGFSGRRTCLKSV